MTEPTYYVEISKTIMPIDPEEAESELIKQMFDEIMKMLREKQIKLESIIQRMTEQETITHESFDRTYKLLLEYGKARKWIPV